MARLGQILLLSSCAGGVLLNLSLLQQLRAAREENSALHENVGPSNQQIATLNDHVVEGREFAQLLQDFRVADSVYAAREPDAGRVKLVLYFPNLQSCRRSLHREAAILKEEQGRRSRTRANTTIVFGNPIDEADFQTMVRQFDLGGVAFLDRSGVFARHLPGVQTNALALLLNRHDRVLFARVLRTSEESGARALYQKLHMIEALAGRGGS